MGFGFTAKVEIEPDPLRLVPEKTGRVGSVFGVGWAFRLKIPALSTRTYRVYLHYQNYDMVYDAKGLKASIHILSLPAISKLIRPS